MFEKLIESSKHRKRGRTGRYFLITCLIYGVMLTAFGVTTIFWFNPTMAEAYFELTSIALPPPLGNPSPPAAKAPTIARSASVSRVFAPPQTPGPIPPTVAPPNVVYNNAPYVTNPCVGCGAAMGLPDGIAGVPTLSNTAPPPPRPVGTPRPDPPPTPTPAPTPAPTPVKPVVMTSKLLQGNAINRVQPPYPQIAKAAGAYGPVQVQIMISEDGRVLTAEVLSGHILLRDASRQAALQWRFKPTILNGVPVPVTGVITFDFQLNR